jgi:hypothetical protein
MSDASDYLSQQITLAASKKPVVTFVSCQRSLGPSGDVIAGIGLATFGVGRNGTVHKDASGKPDGLHFGPGYQWFSDRTVKAQYPHDDLPEWQFFRAGQGPQGGSSTPPNREDLLLDFTLVEMPRFQVWPGSRPNSLSGHRGGLREWVNGDTVVQLDAVRHTSGTNTPLFTVTTSVVDGPSQQLVFNIPGSFKMPGEVGLQRGDPPAVMLVSFNPVGEWNYL